MHHFRHLYSICKRKKKTSIFAYQCSHLCLLVSIGASIASRFYASCFPFSTIKDVNSINFKSMASYLFSSAVERHFFHKESIFITKLLVDSFCMSACISLPSYRSILFLKVPTILRGTALHIDHVFV